MFCTEMLKSPSELQEFIAKKKAADSAALLVETRLAASQCV
jgi:hypothetical protein